MPNTAQNLFTASQVARFCQVDLKTIHNWADRGEIDHFRTPGRHLRFRQPDVLDFLRRYGYPIPQELGIDKPSVAVLVTDLQTGAIVEAQLTDRFKVSTFTEPTAAMIHVGAAQPDAIVVGDVLGGEQIAGLIATLKATKATQRIRAVLFSNNDAHKADALQAGASAFVNATDLHGLKDTLEALMGTER